MQHQYPLVEPRNIKTHAPGTSKSWYTRNSLLRKIQLPNGTVEVSGWKLLRESRRIAENHGKKHSGNPGQEKQRRDQWLMHCCFSLAVFAVALHCCAHPSSSLSSGTWPVYSWERRTSHISRLIVSICRGSGLRQFAIEQTRPRGEKGPWSLVQSYIGSRKYLDTCHRKLLCLYPTCYTKRFTQNLLTVKIHTRLSIFITTIPN